MARSPGMAKEPKQDSREELQALVRDLALHQVTDSHVIEVQAQLQRELGDAHLDVAGNARSLRVARHDVPLPPPDMLQGYETHQRGLSKKIVDNWEANESHQRELASRRVSTTQLRIWTAFAATVLGMGFLCVVACFAPPAATAIVAGSGLGAGVVAVFKRKFAPAQADEGGAEP